MTAEWFISHLSAIDSRVRWHTLVWRSARLPTSGRRAPNENIWIGLRQAPEVNCLLDGTRPLRGIKVSTCCLFGLDTNALKRNQGRLKLSTAHFFLILLNSRLGQFWFFWEPRNEIMKNWLTPTWNRLKACVCRKKQQIFQPIFPVFWSPSWYIYSYKNCGGHKS